MIPSDYWETLDAKGGKNELLIYERFWIPVHVKLPGVTGTRKNALSNLTLAVVDSLSKANY